MDDVGARGGRAAVGETGGMRGDVGGEETLLVVVVVVGLAVSSKTRESRLMACPRGAGGR